MIIGRMALRKTTAVLLFTCCLLQGAVGIEPPQDTDDATEDLIRRLPGFRRPLPTRHYSGFLSGKRAVKLHYWLVESEGSVENDPLIIWFNGGPGCSSLTGLFEENGPFRVASNTKTLVVNPDRWNKIANILYIESPTGTGFSYSEEEISDTDDISARDDKYEAILNFYLRFPRFVPNDMYIFGQSYGGVYVPMLGALITNNANINFRGVGIGNGAVDAKYVIGSLPFYEYTHGFISESDWTEMQEHCCHNVEYGNPDNYLCDFKNCLGGAYFNLAIGTAFGGGVNPYDSHAACSTGSDGVTVSENGTLRERAINMGYPCMDSTPVITYLNRRSVRRAIHIPNNLVKEWYMCGNAPYTYSIEEIDMAPNFQTMLDRGKRVLLYYGTADIVCNFIGARWFANSLERRRVTGERAWYYNDGRGIKQLGGSVIHYEGMDYVSIRGGSHMVPKSCPKQALEVLQRFLNNRWPANE